MPQTLAGSAACFAGSWAASLGAIAYLRAFGVGLGIEHLGAAELARGCALCAAAAAAVESLPVKEVDNVTVPVVAALVSRVALS
jgi:dolichol kinase